MMIVFGWMIRLAIMFGHTHPIGVGAPAPFSGGGGGGLFVGGGG